MAGTMIVELPKGTVVALFICKQSVTSVHQSGSGNSTRKCGGMVVEVSEGHGRRTHHLKAKYAVRAPIWLGDNSTGWTYVTGVWRKLRSDHGS